MLFHDMGRELLNRGVVPHGTIWGATALFHKKYHKLLVKTHLDFIKAGACCSMICADHPVILDITNIGI